MPVSRSFDGGSIFALVGLTDDPPLRAWCEAVDASLKSDERIRSIRWYDERTFEQGLGETWSADP